MHAISSSLPQSHHVTTLSLSLIFLLQHSRFLFITT
ncbi:hypothetical protein AMTRI_Chr04g250960 [Amborella trichopoda]